MRKEANSHLTESVLNGTSSARSGTNLGNSRSGRGTSQSVPKPVPVTSFQFQLVLTTEYARSDSWRNVQDLFPPYINEDMTAFPAKPGATTLIQFRPDPADLIRLKEPFGRLVLGEPESTMPELKKIVSETNPRRVTAVGDVVSRETLSAKISVDLRILDFISMRKPTSSFNINARKTYRVKNPPGVITEESLRAIKQAMKEREVVIYVEGEEDLLTLPCIAESPDKSLVLYGQPSQGLVVVTTNSSTRERASQILARMTREQKG